MVNETGFSRTILVFGASLISPLFLIPIETVFNYPFLIEELTKVVLLLFLVKPARLSQAILVGLLFSFSENMFYLINFITDGIMADYWQRFFLTTVLHTITTVVMCLMIRKDRRLFVPALFLAIAIHYFYNRFLFEIK